MLTVCSTAYVRSR